MEVARLSILYQILTGLMRLPLYRRAIDRRACLSILYQILTPGAVQEGHCALRDFQFSIRFSPHTQYTGYLIATRLSILYQILTVGLGV